MMTMQRTSQRGSYLPLSVMEAKEVTNGYMYDTEAGVFHRAGCPHCAEDAQVRPCGGIALAIKLGYTICPDCFPEMYLTPHAARLRSFVNANGGALVYLRGSKVYHRGDCSYLTNGTREEWRAFRSEVQDAGMHPCTRCHPERAPLVTKPNRRRMVLGATEAVPVPPRQVDEWTQRLAHFPFWASTGYATFHRPDCPKLRGLNNLRGFKSPGEAKHAGFRPCKCCKSTSRKQQMFYGEAPQFADTMKLVNDLCESFGYSHRLDIGYYEVCTPVGRWKINLETEPHQLMHINLMMNPGEDSFYHKQPKVCRTVQEALQYIHLHDIGLMRNIKRVQGSEAGQIAF